jgi:CspA family cold shock protein
MNSWRRNGIVEWFDCKKGYGFINGTDGEKYFVHHSRIEAKDCKFKYLKKGEHVDFDVKGYYKKGKNSKYVASNIIGFETHILECISSQTKKINKKIDKEEWTLLDNKEYNLLKNY